MGEAKYTRIENVVLVAAVVALAWFGHALFSQFLDYTYKSPSHLDDFIRVKLFTLLVLLLAFLTIYLLRERESASRWTVFFLGAHFIVMYGYLFRGTEFGMNGHLGDNAYRMAITCKMMAYNYFADANIKSLTTFYPPLWLWLMSIYAKLLGIEAYQTVKFGYLLIFVVYPWLVYISWKSLVTRAEAAAITVAVILFTSSYLDYSSYEHITAVLFVPWWLYYFENAPGVNLSLSRHWRFYLLGSILGALIFMTYYWWYFMASAAVPISMVIEWRRKRELRIVLQGLWRRCILMVGVALFSSVYWFPLLLSTFEHGLVSKQTVWFNPGYLHISGFWADFFWGGAIVFAGVFSLGIIRGKWRHTNLAFLYLGGLGLILLDRYLNLSGISNQTRKFLEYAPLFAAIPLALACMALWKKSVQSKHVRYGLGSLVLILVITFSDTISSRIYESDHYSRAIGQRVPTEAIAIFEEVDCDKAVFLTHKIFESCYLPFFKFISTTNMGAHNNERFAERLGFLKKLSDVTEPQVLAYLLRFNKYDAIDYIYLPYNGSTDMYELAVSVREFAGNTEKETVGLRKSPLSDSTYFTIRHRSGLYQINAISRTESNDDRIREMHPDLYNELRDVSVKKE